MFSIETWVILSTNIHTYISGVFLGGVGKYYGFPLVTILTFLLHAHRFSGHTLTWIFTCRYMYVFSSKAETPNQYRRFNDTVRRNTLRYLALVHRVNLLDHRQVPGDIALAIKIQYFTGNDSVYIKVMDCISRNILLSDERLYLHANTVPSIVVVR